MLIGVPKEIKTNENRVGLVPVGVEALVREGHQVQVETGAGLGSGFSDEEYVAAVRRSRPARRDLGQGRHGHQGQGADRGRMAADAAQAGDVHLLPLRRRRPLTEPC